MKGKHPTVGNEKNQSQLNNNDFFKKWHGLP